MHARMKATWNSIVKPNDEVWVVGDFAFKGSVQSLAKLCEELNGTLHLILGNHDHKDVRKIAARNPRCIIEPPIVDLTVGDTPIVLCHYPIETWNKKHYGSVHFHGHTHGRSKLIANRADVGWDVHYQPMPLDPNIILPAHTAFCQKRDNALQSGGTTEAYT